MATATEAPAAPLKRFAAMRWSLVLNIAAPLATYEIVTHNGGSELAALAIGAIFPVLGLAIAATRRRLDWIGVITLIAIAGSLAGALLFASPRLLLLKESITTGTVGLAFLASLAAPRPLIFVFARQLKAADAQARATLDQRWSTSPVLRRRIRRLTVLWGACLVAEAATRAVLSYFVTPATLIVLSPLLAAAVFGGLALWTRRGYRAHARA